MPTTNPNGWSMLRRLRDEMDSALQGAFASRPAWWTNLNLQPATSFPALNVWQTEQDVFVEAELPGVTHEQLDISVLSGQLTLRGERRPSGEQQTWHRRERTFGAFERTLRLPADVNADKVEAKLEHGVLTIRLPKAEAAKPRKISVTTIA